MTPATQKEYIITEEDIQILEDSFRVTLIMPRSRPATPPQPTDDAIPFSDWLSINDAKVRNSTIEELYQRIKAERDPLLEYVDWDSIEAVFIRTKEHHDPKK
jgi:3'-phosphoadenosine 5'-phosphosulfate sulfotransferase